MSERAYGPVAAVTPELVAAILTLRNGDKEEARTLWRIITAEAGYFPHIVARALVLAASPNLVAPVIPDESKW